MVKKKNLVFICDVYPSSFVKDEMEMLAEQFDEIYVVMHNEAISQVLALPCNAEIKGFNGKITRFQLIGTLLMLCRPFFLKEIWFVVRKYSLRYWWSIFKIQLVALTQARALQPILANFPFENSVFYSYWHDYKAMALALFRKGNPEINCFARAHRWDVFAEENNPPYLPFKKFIIENLSQTISISEAGKKAFEDYLSQNLDGKVVVSRLGKFNDRTPLWQKTDDVFVICSCSNLIPVKRVDKIIESLSKLHLKNVRWIHFGDGTLRNQMEVMAKTLLPHISFEFKGIVSNEKILDFYASQYVDLFINLSDSEGIPVSIMEALSAGIPVLATNVGGTGECVNTENGFLVEKTASTDDIAAIVDDYFSSDVETVVRKRTVAYEYWRTNYEAGENYRAFSELICR